MADSDKNEIYLSSSPHFHGPLSVQRLMYSVIIALLPICVMGIVRFGIRTLGLIAVSVATCMGSEYIFRELLRKKRKTTVLDGSAIITGIMLALVLPPSVPFWIVILGDIFAIIVVKNFFGGLGQNVWNPALAGRAFLVISFPAIMGGSWIDPKTDAVTSATILSQMKNSTDVMTQATTHATTHATEIADTVTQATTHATTAATQVADAITEATTHASEIADAITEATTHATEVVTQTPGFLDTFMNGHFANIFQYKEYYLDYLWGNRAGCIGESCAILILIAAVVLILLHVIDWRIPVSYIGTVVLCTLISGGDIVMAVLSGGVLFGAVFMATDYVTSPTTKPGMLIFGFGCGLITFLIRRFGGYPEGVMFSILFMNCFYPFLNNFTSRKYGY